MGAALRKQSESTGGSTDRTITYSTYSKVLTFERAEQHIKASRVLFALHYLVILLQIALQTAAASVQTPTIAKIIGNDSRLQIDFAIVSAVAGFSAAVLTSVTHAARIDRYAERAMQASVDITYYTQSKASMPVTKYEAIMESCLL